MESLAAAYGMYAEKTGAAGVKMEIGQEAILEAYYLNFWKGIFLVTITGVDSAKETVEGLLGIARAVDATL